MTLPRSKPPQPRLVKRICRLLEKAHGRPARTRRGKPLDVLISTILSQNTSDVNSGRAFRNLVETFGDWDAVARAPVAAIARAIRSGGLADVKAPRIRSILRDLIRDRRRATLDLLARMDDDEALDYLLSLPGVGLKTANCVLLFSLGRDVFPVDTHILRVAARLRLIPPKASADLAHRLLAEMIHPSDRYSMHINLIAHGRRVCHPRSPECHACVLRRLCPSAKK